MKLTDKKIVDALDQGEHITRKAFYGTVWIVKSSCGALTMGAFQPVTMWAPTGSKAFPYITVEDLRADDWIVME